MVLLQQCREQHLQLESDYCRIEIRVRYLDRRKRCLLESDYCRIEIPDRDASDVCGMTVRIGLL